MGKVFHDEDADPAAIAGATVAIIGYGNQGRSQALNLRDSGIEVVVGNRDDVYRENALADGFDVLSIDDASARGDIIFLLTADEVMPEVYASAVAPHLTAGKLLNFAHGYNIAFDLIVPPEDVDVTFIAPRMIGAGVRDTYLDGSGFASFVGVHQDATGTARQRMLALARALGSTRSGCMEMTMKQEATLDLFTEQAFGPAFGRVMGAAIGSLMEAGYPIEAILMELTLSGEMAYSLLKTREVGSAAQHELHSHTSQYGTMTRGERFKGLDPILREQMNAIIEEIESGAFAREWSSEREQKIAVLEHMQEKRKQATFTRWEDETRRAFRIGNAASGQG